MSFLRACIIHLHAHTTHTCTHTPHTHARTHHTCTRTHTHTHTHTSMQGIPFYHTVCQLTSTTSWKFFQHVYKRDRENPFFVPQPSRQPLIIDPCRCHNDVTPIQGKFPIDVGLKLVESLTLASLQRVLLTALPRGINYITCMDTTCTPQTSTATTCTRRCMYTPLLLCHTPVYCITPPCTVPHPLVLCHAPSYYVTPHYTVSHPLVQSHTPLCCTTPLVLCHTYIPWLVCCPPHSAAL